ncbi:permease-like cell division protein FtsX [Georgenia sp. Z1491]|uniref:permease-like cell division protein FtsX n=1 Tax=Georgenia sp. Z1491 TaxID=3416707 RepID=UPI003CEC4267
MRLRFILGQVSQGIRRNVAMTVAVVLVTFVSLVFVGAGLLLQTQVDRLKDDWYERVEVAVFMCPTSSENPACAAGEATEEEIDAVGNLLESSDLAPYVAEVFLETKEEAYENFRERLEDSAWSRQVTADQMQVSYRVRLEDPEQFRIVADELEGRAGVDIVVDQREQLEPLFVILNRSTAVALGMAGVMAVAAVLLITTTIRLSALSRRRETGIMRLVGASNWVIQAPFMLEGAIAALLGSVLSVGGLLAAVRYGVEGWLAPSAPWVPFVTTSDVWRVAPVLVLAAVLVAGLSSVVSLARYTKV